RCSLVRGPSRSPLFPTRRSSDLDEALVTPEVRGGRAQLELSAVGAHGQARVHRAVHVLPEAALPEVGVGDEVGGTVDRAEVDVRDRKSTRLNSSHVKISYAVFCL